MKKINLKEVYKWPLKAQALIGVLVFAGVLAGGTFFLIMDQNDKLTSEVAKENKLKTDYVNKTKQAVNLNLYKQQLIEITQASDDLLRQLPNKSEVEKLLIDINQAGTARGLKFELFRPGQEKLTEFYAELPIDIQFRGTYDNIGGFAEDLSKLSRVVILNNMKITADPNGVLLFNAQAKTFRYLDQVEINAQRQADAEKRKLDNRQRRGRR